MAAAPAAGRLDGLQQRGGRLDLARVPRDDAGLLEPTTTAATRALSDSSRFACRR